MKDEKVLTGTDVLPFGVLVGHTWHEVGTILRTIYIYEVDAFIEIGTHAGGLASIMCASVWFGSLKRYLGIEINDVTNKRVNEIISKQHPRAQIIYTDCFGETAKNLIRSYITDPYTNRTIIYCDGGDKKRELNEYANMLTSGDIIMAHDYYSGDRIVRDVPDYGSALCEFPVPEVYPSDIHIDRDQFKELSGFEKTRIIGFMKI